MASHSPLSIPPKMTKRKFEDLGSVQAEKFRLKALLHEHAFRLEQRGNALKDPELLKLLVGNTVRNAVSQWGPGRFMARVVGKDQSGIGGYLGGVLASRAKGFKGKAMALVVGALAPAILERLIPPDKLEQFIHYLEGLKERFAEMLHPKDTE